MMYEELMRRKLVSRLYDGMTDEEKRTYLMLRNHSETMNAINGINNGTYAIVDAPEVVEVVDEETIDED